MSVIRRSGVDSGRSALAKAEAALESERAALAETEAALATATTRRDELADVPDSYAANEATISELRTELGRRRRAIGKREGELADAGAALGRAEYEEAKAALERAYATERKHSGALGETLATLDRQAAELVKDRERTSALEAKVRALAPDDVDDAFAGLDRDEPDWPEIDDALEVASAGPRRPDAATAATIERADEERKRAEAGRAARAVKEFFTYGDFAAIRKITPEQLPTALEFAERLRAAEVERLTNATADSPFAGAGGRAKDTAEMLDRRVERIRALASGVSAAA